MNWKAVALWTFTFLGFLSTQMGATGLVEEGDTILIEFGGGTFQRGDTVCFDMTYTGFDNVIFIQYGINWDPNVIKLVDIRDINPGGEIQFFSRNSFGTVGSEQGSSRVVWLDDNLNGQSAPDGFVVARLCFEIVGAPGDKTALTVSDFPIGREAEDPNEVPFCIPITTNPICVGQTTRLFAKTTACSTEGAEGELSVKAWGNSPPFLVSIPELGIVNASIDVPGDCLNYDNLTPGEYNVTVRDGMGNDTMINIRVFDSPRINIDTSELIFPTCANSSNGRIIIDVTGGVPFNDGNPFYLVSWEPISAPGVTTLRRLPSGKYIATAQDSLGCIATDSFDFDAAALSVDTNLIQAASCDGRNDGELEVIPSGGAPLSGGRYRYFWSDGFNDIGRTSTNDNLSGTGFVIVEDDNGCRDTVFYDIPTRFSVDLAFEIDSVQCFGDSTGKLRIIATTSGMASGPYFFIVEEDGIPGPVLGGGVTSDTYFHDSIWAGTFVVRVRDANFCTLIDTFEIHQPDPVEVILVDINTSAGCDEISTAYLEVDGFSGSGAPYRYQWDYENRTTARIDSLPVGMYTVTVFDVNDCEATRSFEVTGNNGPEITGFDITPVGCSGDTSGRVTVFYTLGDTTIASIDWSNGESGEEIVNLGEGQYIVTITDENGCRAIDTAQVDPPMDGLMITSFIIDTPSCNGLFDGFLQVNVAGGVGPYTFQWSNNERDSILTQIGAGQYIVAVRDQSNCPPVLDTFTVPDPPSIDINLISTEMVSCDNDTVCDGQAIAEASGGPEPERGYVFTWESGEIGFGTPDTANALCKGDQLLIVSNGNCADSLEINIDAPPPLNIDFPASNLIRPSCFGDGDGSIQLVTTGGTGVRTVTWDRNMFMGNNLNNIPSGTYAFTVEDNNGCEFRDSLELRDPAPLVASIIEAASSDIRCQGGSDGRISILWNGGNSGPASFNWTPGGISDSVRNELAAGDYQIIVTDSKGCMDTVERTISEPDPIVADFPSSDSVNCFGDQLPVTVVAANGGNGPNFTYTINNGARRPLGEEVNLFAGTYTITVFDAKGCMEDTTILIQQPDEFEVDLGPGPIEMELGDSTTICYATNLVGRRIDSVVWTGLGTPEDSTLRCLVIKPTENTLYMVEVKDQFGCSANDQLEVIVLNQGKVFVPNVFSPEGNINTVLSVFTGPGVQTIDFMEIYNRWGELVYRQEDLQNGDGWNGRWENTGDLLLNDVYVYVVKVTYKDNTTEFRRGDVTLIR